MGRGGNERKQQGAKEIAERIDEELVDLCHEVDPKTFRVECERIISSALEARERDNLRVLLEMKEEVKKLKKWERDVQELVRAAEECTGGPHVSGDCDSECTVETCRFERLEAALAKLRAGEQKVPAPSVAERTEP